MASFILATADPLTHPAGEQFLRLGEHLSREGHDVVVLYSRSDRSNVPASSEAPVGSLSVVPWPSTKPSRLVDGLFFWRLLRRVRPTCVVGRRNAVNWTLFLGWLCRIRSRIGWHSSWPSAWRVESAPSTVRHYLLTRRRALLYRCATRIVVAAKALVGPLSDAYGVPAELCVVVGNGVSEPVVHSRRRADVMNIVCLGRLERSKNHAVAVEAFARLGKDLQARCRLTLIGEGSCREDLEALVDRLGLRDFVTFAGGTNRAEAMRILSTGDLLLHPSAVDNFPLAILEAMSFGIPTIATRVGGIAEIIESEREGILVDDGHLDQLTRALDRVLKDPVLRERLGTQSRERFLREFEMNGWVRTVGSRLVREAERGR